MFVIISPFNTINESSTIFLIAFLIAPPVPSGDVSTEYSILHPKLFFLSKVVIMNLVMYI